MSGDIAKADVDEANEASQSAPEKNPQPQDRRPRSYRGEDRPAHRQRALTVFVDERGIEPALRAFKKLIQKEGLLKDLKRRQHHEKPSDRARRKRREAMRRRRRQESRRREWR